VTNESDEQELTIFTTTSVTTLEEDGIGGDKIGLMTCIPDVDDDNTRCIL